MSNDWTLNSQMFASWDADKPQGIRGLGFYQLIIPIKVATHNVPKEQTITVTNISGALHVQGIGSQSNPTLLGRLVQQGTNYPITTYEHVANHQISLEIELDAKRIDAIEQIRLGENLTFLISLFATANSGGLSQQLYSQPHQLTISQSDWIKVLESIGYRKTLLIEIPVPTGEANPALTEATKHLANAQKQMLHGHYREAVSSCRDVLESLNRSISDEGESAQTSKKKRDKRERFLAIRTALLELTHAAKHVDDTTSLIEWNLADARASISLTATLLQWASEEYSG
jgi:hypothetical protein